MGTLWIRRKDGKLYKQYAGQWKDDYQDGRGACLPPRTAGEREADV